MPPTPQTSPQTQRIEALERRMDKYDSILDTMGKQLVKIETLFVKQDERVERLDVILLKVQEAIVSISTLVTRHDTHLSESDATAQRWRNGGLGFLLTLVGAAVSALVSHLLHP